MMKIKYTIFFALALGIAGTASASAQQQWGYPTYDYSHYGWSGYQPAPSSEPTYTGSGSTFTYHGPSATFQGPGSFSIKGSGFKSSSSSSKTTTSAGTKQVKKEKIKIATGFFKLNFVSQLMFHSPSVVYMCIFTYVQG